MAFRSRKPWLLALMSGTIAPMPDQPTRPIPRRRWKFVAGLSLAVMLVIVGGWLGSNQVQRDPPERLWTRADLPSAPAEADNGWALLTDQAQDVEVPEQLLSLVNSRELAVDELWAAVETHGEQLHAWLGSEAILEALARFEAARARPMFVDACAPEQRCRQFNVVELHRAAELEALELARSQQLDAAATRVGELIRMDIRHLASARTTVSALIALSNLVRALDKADKLAAHPSVLGQPPSPAMLELARVVETVDVESLDLGVPVISEYLFIVDALDSLDAGRPLPEQLSASSHRAWLYDHGQTMVELNQRFERRHAAARAGDVAGAFGAGEPALTESFGWWLHDPTGKLVLDAMRFDASSLAASITEQREAVASLRASVLARL